MGTAAVALLLALGAPAQAGSVVTHSGSADPEAEGWTGIGNVDVEGWAEGVDDGGTAAWRIADTSTGNDQYAYYSYALSGEDLSGAWTATARARVEHTELDTTFKGVNFACSFAVADGSDLWRVDLLGSGSGPPDSDYGVWHWDSSTTPGQLVQLVSMNAGAGYHYFQLIYPGEGTSVDLYVDGIHAGEISADQAESSTQMSVAFGSANFWDEGTSYWNEVSFETGQHPVEPIPEPFSVATVAMAVCGLRVYYRRKRRAA